MRISENHIVQLVEGAVPLVVLTDALTGGEVALPAEQVARLETAIDYFRPVLGEQARLPHLPAGRERFYLSFGARGLADGYVVIDAADYDDARGFCFSEYGTHWSNLMDQAEWDRIPLAERARFWPRGMHGHVKV